MCDTTTCRHATPGKFAPTVVVNNSEAAPRFVQLSSESESYSTQELVIQAPPGDSVHPGPVIQGTDCPAPNDFPISVEFMSS